MKHAACVALALSLAGILSGCGLLRDDPTPPPVAEADPTPNFEGFYQGREELVMGEVPQCPREQYGFVSVGDGTLLYAYSHDLVFVARPGTTGELHATAGDGALDGSIADDRMVFTVKTPDCQTDFRFRRISGF